MTFVQLIISDLRARLGRSAGVIVAVALAVTVVVTLAVTSSGLESSAAEVISISKADFTVAQKGVPDILSSAIDEGQLHRIATTPGVARALGVLVETEHISSANPLFVEIGIAPADLTPFGVTVVAGRPYAADALNECMLGWRAASNLGLHVGSRFHANGAWNTVTGIYSTGNAFGDSGAMFPLPAVQAYNRLPGIVTLVFVKVTPGSSPAAVARLVGRDQPELTTIRTASQFGRADRNLVYLQAAVNGSTVLAVLIGAVIVGNAMLMSLVERTREFGLLRAVGWTRRRSVGLLLSESVVLSFIGAVVGVLMSFVITAILERLPALRGILHAAYSKDAFLRALLTALAMTIIGGLYPSLRTARLSPLRALSYE